MVQSVFIRILPSNGLLSLAVASDSVAKPTISPLASRTLASEQQSGLERRVVEQADAGGPGIDDVVAIVSDGDDVLGRADGEGLERVTVQTRAQDRRSFLRGPRKRIEDQNRSEGEDAGKEGEKSNEHGTDFLEACASSGLS